MRVIGGGCPHGGEGEAVQHLGGEHPPRLSESLEQGHHKEERSEGAAVASILWPDSTGARVEVGFEEAPRTALAKPSVAFFTTPQAKRRGGEVACRQVPRRETHGPLSYRFRRTLYAI